ncbi:hypothetical protein BST61_g9537 [Cercospora zeina]
MYDGCKATLLHRAIATRKEWERDVAGANTWRVVSSSMAEAAVDWLPDLHWPRSVYRGISGWMICTVVVMMMKRAGGR